jgi:hypothetical protein
MELALLDGYERGELAFPFVRVDFTGERHDKPGLDLTALCGDGIPAIDTRRQLQLGRPAGFGRRFDLVEMSGRAPRKRTAKAAPTAADAEGQLRRFIDRFEPSHRALIRAVRRALRKRLPTANELAYDNYHFFVIGYGPTERP